MRLAVVRLTVVRLAVARLEVARLEVVRLEAVRLRVVLRLLELSFRRTGECPAMVLLLEKVKLCSGEIFIKALRGLVAWVQGRFLKFLGRRFTAGLPNSSDILGIQYPRSTPFNMLQ